MIVGGRGSHCRQRSRQQANLSACELHPKLLWILASCIRACYQRQDEVAQEGSCGRSSSRSFVGPTCHICYLSSGQNPLAWCVRCHWLLVTCYRVGVFLTQPKTSRTCLATAAVVVCEVKHNASNTPRAQRVNPAHPRLPALRAMAQPRV